MKIVYTSWSGALASVVAALHLGRLAEGGRPAPQQITSVPFFAALGRFDHGFLFPCGRDRNGNEIFIAGCGRMAALVARAAAACLQMTGEETQGIEFVNCRRAGGFWAALAETLGEMSAGRRRKERIAGRAGGGGRQRSALVRLIGRRYAHLADLARSTRDRVRRG